MTVCGRLGFLAAACLRFSPAIFKALEMDLSVQRQVSALGILVAAPLTRSTTRIVTITEDGKAQRIRYELVDVRAVLQWLDAIGPTERERYFTFADPARSRLSVSFIAQSSLECDYVVRTRQGSTVFCLLPGDERLVFPNAATFMSWYPTFETVETVPDEALYGFTLKRNVTLRPGTLVKSQTYAEVYLVTDVFGTMRHIPSEARAIELWGANWASLVRDVPDEFFTNYTIGPELS